jgi:hypothetical protein
LIEKTELSGSTEKVFVMTEKRNKKKFEAKRSDVFGGERDEE